MLPHLPEPPCELFDAALLDAQEEAHRLGITGIHEWKAIRAGGVRAPRHGRCASAPGPVSSPRRNTCPIWCGAASVAGRAPAGWRIGGVKLFLDGSLGSGTAWMLEPYAGVVIGDAYHHGAGGRCGHAHGGGRGNRRQRACDRRRRRAARARSDDAAAAVGLPHRIEHFQCVHPDDLGRAAAAGIVVSMQPAHLLDRHPLVERHWGAARPGNLRLRDPAAARDRMVFGSDTPVASLDPREGLYAALERRGEAGAPLVAGEPRRNWVSRAVHGYTLGRRTRWAAGRPAAWRRAGTPTWLHGRSMPPPSAARRRRPAGRARLTVVRGEVVMHGDRYALDSLPMPRTPFAAPRSSPPSARPGTARADGGAARRRRQRRPDQRVPRHARDPGAVDRAAARRCAASRPIRSASCSTCRARGSASATLPAPIRLEPGQTVVFVPEDEATAGEMPTTYDGARRTTCASATASCSTTGCSSSGDRRPRRPGATRVVPRRRAQGHKGMNLPGRRGERAGDHREGPRGRGAGASSAGRRLRRALVRAPAGGHRRAAARWSRDAISSSPRSRRTRRSRTSCGILDASDAVMVARGDLGVELPFEEVPLVQKQIIREAGAPRQAGDHRDPDARVDDPRPAADAGRGERRGQRDPRRHRCGDAVRRDGGRGSIPLEAVRGDGPDRAGDGGAAAGPRGHHRRALGRRGGEGGALSQHGRRERADPHRGRDRGGGLRGGGDARARR